MEAQGLWTKEDEGDWASMTLEYNISPAWFFAVMDEWNYGKVKAFMEILTIICRCITTMLHSDIPIKPTVFLSAMEDSAKDCFVWEAFAAMFRLPQV